MAAGPALRAHGASAPRARFRSQVARRDYAGAYRSLVAAPGVAEHSAEDLMLAADAARLSGHPAAAVPYLRRLLRAFPSDVRGPVAAFTLGRVLLADPRACPGRGRRRLRGVLYRLAPTGPRWPPTRSRARSRRRRAPGDAAQARDRVAAVYGARYPKTRRAGAGVVRRAAGLE